MTRLLSIVFIMLNLLIQPAFAMDNQHLHPSIQSTPKAQGLFGDCYIEIVNDSFSNVTVYGRYDDGVPLVPFNVYSYEFSHYIDMFYNGYCHSGMYVSVVTFSGYTIFSGYVFTGSTIHIVPLMNKQLKVTVDKKH